MPVTIEDVTYTVDYKGIVYKATVGERTRQFMVRVADLDLPRGNDSLHEFMRRINEVNAATETAILDAPGLLRRAGGLASALGEMMGHQASWEDSG
jgi:hypothetical protein